MSGAAKISWTAEQRDAIESVGESLVVSAAAGSGKTAVLAARCVSLVVGGKEPPCGVDELLVVTFTNAAARQMRDRIARRLADAARDAEQTDDRNRLANQLEQLPRAFIGTLSSFCSQLVRRYFHRIDIDPNFTVLDEDQARLLKRQVATDLIERGLADADSGTAALLDDLFDGRDDSLVRMIISTHDLLTSLVDPQAWMAESIRRIEEAAERPMHETQLGRDLLAAARQELSHLPRLADEADRAADVAERSEETKKLTKLATYTREWAQAAKEVHAALTAKDAQRVRVLLEELPAKKPTVLNTVPGKAALDAALEPLRTAFSDKGPANRLLAWDADAFRTAAASTVAPTRTLLALIQQFGDRYAAEKRRGRTLDFADLERLALRLLSDDAGGPSAVAQEQRRRYAHVLVDESQDINELQDTLLRLLGRENPPNLFRVGDVKQSIYRFRLAEPRMFMERLTEAGEGRPGHRRIDLQRNFRSRAPLLMAINAAFNRLMSDREAIDIDYADHHALFPDPAKDAPPLNGFTGAPVELHVLDPSATAEQDEEATEDADTAELERIEREAVFVAQRLHELKAEGQMVAGEDGPEPFDFRHVAVLLRAQKFNSERFAGALRRAGVPCHSEIGTGFFAAMEVRDVLNVLRLLDNPRQDIPLAAVVRSPLAGLGDGVNAADVLGQVAVRAKAAESRFFEAAAAWAGEADSPLRPLFAKLERWRDLSRRLPLADLIDLLLTESGYLTYVAGLDNGPQRRANLRELQRRAGQFDDFRSDGLGAFLTFLQALDESGEVGQPPSVAAGENVVRVMSIHASKGLEFPVVFLADCGKRHNTADTSRSVLIDRQSGLAVPAIDRERQVRYDSPQQTLAKRELKRAAIAEELRVLYVAMTRAKEHLVCVGHAWRNAENEAAAWAKLATEDRLPPAVVLGGQSFLDWLGMSAAGNEDHFALTTHPASSLDRALGPAHRQGVPEFIRSLKPPPEPPTERSPKVAAAVRRLESPYAFVEQTDRRAAEGFGEEVVVAEMPPPRFLEASDEPDEAECRRAIKIALRHLDLNHAGDASAVQQQLDAMVARHLLSDRLAAMIDPKALAWFAGSELGEAIRSARRVWRDLPVIVPKASAGGDRLDRVMARGRIDVVAELADGDGRVNPSLLIADYLTGRPSPEAGNGAGAAALRWARQAASAAAPEVRARRDAVVAITGQEPVEAVIVVLAARQIVRL